MLNPDRDVARVFADPRVPVHAAVIFKVAADGIYGIAGAVARVAERLAVERVLGAVWR